MYCMYVLYVCTVLMYCICYLEECDKLLSVGGYQEHDDMPFCKTCYGKLFGPKGYGFAGGSAGLSANRDDDTLEQVTMRWV